MYMILHAGSSSIYVTTQLYALLLSPPVLLPTMHNSIALTVLHEKYKFQSCSSCNFLHSLVTPPPPIKHYALPLFI